VLVTVSLVEIAVTSAAPVSFRDAVRVWLYVGLNSFGGPAGQIAVMHRVIVDERRWVSEQRFLHALNYCMLLPGPEAQQLSVYIGWLLHGTRGGLVAGTLFVLPGAIAMLALSAAYAAWRNVGWVEAAFFGVKAAVLAVVVDALVRIGRRTLKSRLHVVLAAAAFVAIFFFDVAFPWVVLGAACIGLLFRKSWPGAATAHAVLEGRIEQPPTSLARTVRTVAIGLVLWFAPILILAAALGRDSVFVHEATFFSRAAVVTFGGAYSVLAYVAQQAVDVYGWLEPGQMLDGLGLAETTPGPLILVVQFVAYLGAFRHPGALDPWVAGVLGSLVALWVTFVPSFLWIFAGAPYVEMLRGNRALHAALSAITASVVGVILNLSLWFGLHTLFDEVEIVRAGPLRFFIPGWNSLSWLGLAIFAGAAVAMLRFKVRMLPTLAVSAVLGALVTWIS
jgi:chromate transporter